MCLTCSTLPDPAKQDAFAEHLLEVIRHGMTTLLISIGHRTGLFDRLADGLPRTSAELAACAGLHERYVREWLGGMVTSRIIERNPADGTHRLPPEHAHWLSRHSPSANMAVFAQYLPTLAAVEEQILDCFQHGGGVPYAAYPRFHEVMAEDSGQSVVPMILEEIVPLFPGLHERLLAGIDVLDVGCGKGRALMRLAAAYPQSRFTGYDLGAEVIEAASAEAARLGLGNLRFVRKDLTHWEGVEAFDWITAFDAIHDQARPDLVLKAIYQALRPGGHFLMQDIDLSSEPVDNIEHPLGNVFYTISLMHCMTVSLAQGGMGLGTAWGVQLAESMLREAGFGAIRIHRFSHDIQNAYFLMQK